MSVSGGEAAGIVSDEASWSLYAKLFKGELILQNYEKVDKRLSYFEDAALVILCVLEAEKCVLLDKPMYYYRQRNQSLYHSIVPNWLEQVNIFYRNMEKYVAGRSEMDGTGQVLCGRRGYSGCEYHDGTAAQAYDSLICPPLPGTGGGEQGGTIWGGKDWKILPSYVSAGETPAASFMGRQAV